MDNAAIILTLFVGLLLVIDSLLFYLAHLRDKQIDLLWQELQKAKARIETVEGTPKEVHYHNNIVSTPPSKIKDELAAMEAFIG